jgi:membrane fusion protein
VSTLFRNEVLESRGHSLFGGIVVPTTRVSTVFAAAALLAAAGVLVLISFGSYASKVAVPGYLVPTAGLAHVVPGRSGVVERVLVRESDVVEAGTPLFVVGSQRVTPGRSADVDSVQIERLSLDRAVLDQQMVRERELSAAVQTALSARIETLRRQHASAQAQSAAARSSTCTATGFVMTVFARPWSRGLWSGRRRSVPLCRLLSGHEVAR